MKRTISIVLMSLTVLALAVSCKHKNPEEKLEFITKKIERKLDLNDLQKEKLKTLKNKALIIHKNKKSTKEDFYNDIKKLVLQDNIKVEEIKSLLDRKRNEVDQILPEVLPELIDFHGSLSSQQKDKLVKTMERFAKRRHGKKRH